MNRSPRYSEEEAHEAIAASLSYTEALRRLGMRPAGGNHKTLRKYVNEIWKIPVDHFDPDAARRIHLRHDPIPLEQILVEGSTYSRARRRTWRRGRSRGRRMTSSCAR